jgi:hypothetical protein
MSAPVYTCPACRGHVKGSRTISLQVAVDHHEATCPAVAQVRR